MKSLSSHKSPSTPPKSTSTLYPPPSYHPCIQDRPHTQPTNTRCLLGIRVVPFPSAPPPAESLNSFSPRYLVIQSATVPANPTSSHTMNILPVPSDHRRIDLKKCPIARLDLDCITPRTSAQSRAIMGAGNFPKWIETLVIIKMWIIVQGRGVIKSISHQKHSNSDRKQHRNIDNKERNMFNCYPIHLIDLSLRNPLLSLIRRPRSPP